MLRLLSVTEIIGERMESAGEYVGTILPPPADHASPLVPAPSSVRIKKLVFNICAGALAFLIGWGLSALFGWRWLFWTGTVLGAIVAIFGGYTGLNAMIAPCPYCRKPVGTTGEIDLTASDENVRVECAHCHEFLVSNKGELRAFTPTDAKGGQTFEAPLFTGGVWLTECLVCGRPSTRTEEARKISVELTQLLVGRLSVNQASVAQIPYCDDHGGAVAITKKDDAIRIVFTDPATHRRYLAVNAQKIPVK